MSFNKQKWNQNNWDRRGRGGFNRGGYGRGNRGFWGHQSYRSMQPYSGNQGPYWAGNWNQDGYMAQGNRNTNRQWSKPKREMPGKRLSEQEIGVTEFVSDHEGFNGIIKSRYSDFQVSEINEKGEVAKLTDVTPPTLVTDDTIDEDEDLLLTKYNVEILPMETWDRINKLVVTKGEAVEKVEIDVTGMTKEQRTKIHDAVKKAFGDSIVGSTINKDEKKLVCFDKYRKGVRIDHRVKWMWPGEYVYFVVYKERLDTMEAAVLLAEKLRMNMKPSMLGYSGTKDRRAKTSQWFSVRRVDPRKISRAASSIHLMRVGNFTFADAPLKLGMLKGNKFRIALRNVTAKDELIVEACKFLEERGFINYYGLQRFGTRVETPTYQIGVKLLQGNFKEAIDLILEERQGPLETALRQYRSAGPAAAVRALTPGAAGAHEARLLRALARAPADYLGALHKLPRNTRLLYLHSYQSLIWNRCVSERIKRFGLAPAVGDLVPLANVEKQELDEEDSDEEDASEKESDQNVADKETSETTPKKSESTPNTPESTPNKPESSPSEAQTAPETKGKKKQKQDIAKPKIPVKILTREDVVSGRYTIFDIIMPLPGYNIDYPPNMKEYYEELMTKDKLDLQLKHKYKSYNMSGAYRHLIVRPFDVSWSLVRYTDPHADLILSDGDEIDNVKSTGILEDGKYKALLLTLSLPASCYATMALRELLKVDTSGDFQALQNNYYKKSTSTETEATKETVATENKEEAKETENGEKKLLEAKDTENGEKRKLEEEDDAQVKKIKTEE